MTEPTRGASASERIKVVRLADGPLEEIHVSATPAEGAADAASQARAIYSAVSEALEDVGSLRIVSERLFGNLSVKEALLSGRARALSAAGVPADGPVSVIEGLPIEGDALAGTQLVLVRTAEGVDVEPVCLDGATCGYLVTSPDVRRLYLSAIHGVVAGDAPGSPEEQARCMFERARDLIVDAGLSYGNVVCTRIYLRRILDWYDEFNAVRTPLYEKLGLTDAAGPFAIPASTGIQGSISDACEVFMDVFVVRKGETDTCPFETLHNPLQSEATAYGSSFARAVSVDVPGGRYVLVSGTASIDEAGNTVHVDDVRGQIRRTMANFKAVLSAGGAGLEDMSHAVWYCKEAAFASVVREEMQSASWPAFPFMVVKADVCRHDLLVEIDGAAVIPA